MFSTDYLYPYWCLSTVLQLLLKAEVTYLKSLKPQSIEKKKINNTTSRIFLTGISTLSDPWNAGQATPPKIIPMTMEGCETSMKHVCESKQVITI